MHGYGVMEFRNGEKYEGEWKDVSKTGLGMYREFSNCNMEEYGYEWTICTRYKGLPSEGEGAIIYANGKLERGKFVSNYPFRCRFISDPNKKVSENKKIEILIKKAIKESKEKLQHKINKIKENEMVQDVEFLEVINNKFKVTYEKEGTYFGQFGENGLRKGKGTMKYNNGDIYEGEWKEDKPDGEGKYFFKNKSSYKGNFREGLREGKGTMKYNNGDIYEGEWKEDVAEGYGIYYVKEDKEWRVGNFVDGSLTGKGAILDENGDIKEKGIFKDNVLQKKENIDDDSIEILIGIKKEEIE